LETKDLKQKIQNKRLKAKNLKHKIGNKRFVEKRKQKGFDKKW
jgi:hypothetical protein